MAELLLRKSTQCIIKGRELRMRHRIAELKNKDVKSNVLYYLLEP